MDSSTGNILPSKVVRERFGGISDVTLARWVERGTLPQPLKINGRNYWREADMRAAQERAK